MIGETVIAARGTRNAWIVWLVIGVTFIACDFAMQEHHLLILSLAPFAIAFAAFFSRREPLIVEFHDDGMEVRSPDLEYIPYGSIEALTIGNEPSDQFSFAVLHRNGALNFPASINFDSRDVYRFLRRELPEEEIIGPPPSLRHFMRGQDEQFGEEKVFAYRSLAGPRIETGLIAIYASAALFAVSILWILIGSAAHGYRDWIVAGVLLCLVSAAAFIIMLTSRRPSTTSPGDGGIVIAPAGIAVEQGPLLGQMRWEEITDIELNRMTRSLCVHVLGGILNLRDDYHRSLRLIYRRLLDYWEGPIQGEY